ncbi:hypothetical protein CEQ90_06615 [Lewinellaceae bacterium SD302]|nr:hypothetical protein CEQ90_06615 [Lewinellaceae bacterium SD302]
MANEPERIVFVGSFQQPNAQGVLGGVMYACTSLLNSPLGCRYEWLPVDSTAATTVTERRVLDRILPAWKRLMVFLRFLRQRSPSAVLIFTSAGWSFYEKGLMCRLARFYGCRVLLAPRSGLIKNDVADSSFFRRYLSATLSQTDVLICQSESWRKFYRSFLPDSTDVHLSVVHNWIDVNQYPYAPITHTPGETLRVLFLGKLDRNKGVYDLLATHQSLGEQSIAFTLAGEGPEKENLQKHLLNDPKADNFTLVGWADHKTKLRLLKDAHVLVLPSYREGYPNVILEAMASGVAVVATRVGAIPEILQDGKSGTLVDPGNVDQLRQALIDLSEHPKRRSQIVTNARRIVSSRNELAIAVEAFQSVLDGPNAP